MKPKSQESSNQTDVFNTRLVDFLNQRHELVLLAKVIDWDTLETEFGQFFEPIKGAPALPTRLVAGLHYLNMPLGCLMKLLVSAGLRTLTGSCSVAKSISNMRYRVIPPH